MRLTNDPIVEKLIAQYRSGDDVAKRKLPAICWHASFPKGKRKSDEAVPSGLGMADFDHLTPEKLQLIAANAIPNEEQHDKTPILLVHITPSGKGLRVVFRLSHAGIFAQCRSMADYQLAMARYLHAEEFLDRVCVDLARLSFVPQSKDVLYLNDRLFTDPPLVTELEPSSPGTAAHHGTRQQYTADLFPASVQSHYEGLPLKDIFEQYISLTGGMPHEGGRNSRYYAAARDLRYICDFNPYVVASHLPDCGLPANEVLQLCTSACQSNRGASTPEEVLKAMALTRALLAEAEAPVVVETPAEESTEQVDVDLLPPLMRDFVRCSPEDFREAVILALLPIVGTLSTHIRAVYADHEEHSTSFFTVVSSGQASGKSFARRLVRQLLATIAEEDALEREIENKFRSELKLKKNAKEQPEEPRTKIRLIPASISIAKLLQRLDYAEGEHLFSFAEEMDTLIKSNKGGAWSEKNDLYRNGFDNSLYGQDYMSETSYSTSKPVFYNLLVLGTPRQTWRFFNDVENGLVSRCCFAFLPDQFGQLLPQWQPMDNDTILRVDHYVKLLRDARGTVDLSFVLPDLMEWQREQRDLALKENNPARDTLRRRSGVIAFRSVLAFSPLYNLKLAHHREQLCKFAIFMANLVLRNQLHFAQDKLNELMASSDLPASRGHVATSVYEELPDEFNVSLLATEMQKRGMRTLPRKLLHKWKSAGLIEKTEINKFKKIIH